MRLIVLLLLLTGCASNHSVSESIAENTIQEVNSLEQNLSAECKTDAVMTQLTIIKSQIRTSVQSCEMEKDVITQEKLKWKWAFFGLLSVIVVLLIKKVLK